MESKEFINHNRKVARAQKTKKITQLTTDIFTQLCAKELGVECVKELQFYKSRKWRFDYALPKYKIALEVEGGVWTRGRHTRPQGFLGDMNKYNTATLCGWRVFRTTPGKLLSSDTLLLLKNAISGAFVSNSGEEDEKMRNSMRNSYI